LAPMKPAPPVTSNRMVKTLAGALLFPSWPAVSDRNADSARGWRPIEGRAPDPIAQQGIRRHYSSQLFVRTGIGGCRRVPGIGMQGPQLASIGMGDLVLGRSGCDAKRGVWIEGGVFHVASSAVSSTRLGGPRRIGVHVPGPRRRRK
jgi:hypothetical protein